jgi:hypothetical protein
LVANVLKGKPVVRCDGRSQFLAFTLPLNGWTDMTIAMVSRASQDLDVVHPYDGRSALSWSETQAWGKVYLLPLQRVFRWRFGIGQAQDLAQLRFERTATTAFSRTVLVRDAAATGRESLYVDGNIVASVPGKTLRLAGIADTGNVCLGYGVDWYFPGDIAEILVFRRALGDADRAALDRYLVDRYF